MKKQKRVIDFSGLTIEDLGFAPPQKADEQAKSEIFGNTDLGNTKLENTEPKNVPKVKKSTKNPTDVQKTHLLTRRSVHFELVRDYLDKKLGDKERVEIKLSEMRLKLGMEQLRNKLNKNSMAKSCNSKIQKAEQVQFLSS
jgi:hypothetical protein